MRTPFLFIILFGFTAASWAQGPKENNRAKENDRVFIVLNFVKDEARADYEKFMAEVFFDALVSSTNTLTKETYQKSRWLSPAQQNQDKTWTYAFIMDPVVENASYQIRDLFEEKYSPEEAGKLLAKYQSFMGAPAQLHALVQTQH